jgi:uncharacterized protein (DUF3084 family)
MKTILQLAVIVLFLLSIGCATKDYVKQQIEPFEERFSKIESEAADTQELAQKAMKVAKDCCDRAESAAARAEAAAKKAEKAFELQQKK